MADTWQALMEAGKAARDARIAALFDRDPDRFGGFSVRLGDMLLDFSKTGIDARTLTLLIELAAERGVPERRDLMFAGAQINATENRPVLHVALRNRANTPILVDGKDVMPEVNEVLERMARLRDGVRSGAITASDGGRFTDVVNIGIGGSRPRAGDGDAGAGALSRRAARRISSRTSTARISTTRCSASIRSARCSSSRPRPSPPSRR